MNWSTFYQTITSPVITLDTSIFKLCLSLLAGGIIGLNREQHQQAAGFRTHILICMGATLLMILSIYIPQAYFSFKNGDPGRIAAQVVSGIGFLGAGAIMRFGKSVKGLTTAASIWLISAVGLTIGAGLYIISLITVVLALFALIPLGWLEHKLVPQAIVKNISLVFTADNFPETRIKQMLAEKKIEFHESTMTIIQNDSTLTEFRIAVQIPKQVSLSELLTILNTLEAIKSIKIV
jgi:putative Mg2+ transporter-C (MgtC) family protein